MIYDATTTRIPGLPRCHVIGMHLLYEQMPTAKRVKLPTAAGYRAALDEIPADAELVVLDDAHRLDDRGMVAVLRRVKAETGLPVAIYSQVTATAGNLRNLILPHLQKWDIAAFTRNRRTATEPLGMGGLRGTVLDHVAAICPSLYLKADMAQHTPLADLYSHKGRDPGQLAAWTCVAHAALHAAYRYAGGKPVLPFVWIAPDAVDDRAAAGTYIANWLAGIGQDWILWNEAEPFTAALKSRGLGKQ